MTIKIWVQFRTHFKNRNALLSAAVYGNHLFFPALGGTAFREWYRAGVECVKNLFKDGVFMSAAQLEKEYGIPSKTNYLIYFQVREFVRKTFSSSLAIPQSGWIDGLLDANLTLPGSMRTSRRWLPHPLIT